MERAKSTIFKFITFLKIVNSKNKKRPNRRQFHILKVLFLFLLWILLISYFPRNLALVRHLLSLVPGPNDSLFSGLPLRAIKFCSPSGPDITFPLTRILLFTFLIITAPFPSPGSRSFTLLPECSLFLFRPNLSPPHIF